MKNNARGQAVIEMAVLTPLLLFVAVGLIDVGRVARYSLLVDGAARAGVQYGARNGVAALDLIGMKAAALNDGQNIANLKAVPTEYALCSNGVAPVGNNCPTGHRLIYVQVVASGSISTLIHYPGVPGSINVSRTEIMRVAQ